MPMAIPIVMVAAAAIAAYGAYQQGQAAKKAANFNVAVQRQNAEISLTHSRAKAAQVERASMLRLGMIKANQGAAGGTPEGSVMDVLGNVAAEGELERQQTLYAGEAEARGYQNTAVLDTFRGRAASQAGALGAGSELLGGAAGAYGASTRLNRR